jgi:hypothetical protein
MPTNEYHHHHNPDDPKGRNIEAAREVLNRVYTNFIQNSKKAGANIENPKIRMQLLEVFRSEWMQSNPRFDDLINQFYKEEEQKIKLKKL